MRPPGSRRRYGLARAPGASRVPYDTVPEGGDEEEGGRPTNDEETAGSGDPPDTTDPPAVEAGNNTPPAGPEAAEVIRTVDLPTIIRDGGHVRIRLSPPLDSPVATAENDSIRAERRQRGILMMFLIFVLLQLWGQYVVTGDPSSLLLALLGSSYVARLARAFREREEEIERMGAATNPTGEASDEDLAVVLSRIREMMRGMAEAGEAAETGVSERARETWKKFPYPSEGETPAGLVDGLPGCCAHAGDDDEDGAPSCSICLEEYAPGDAVVLLPCGHIYHGPCVEEWAAGHTRCPLCNFDLEGALNEHEGEENCLNAAVASGGGENSENREAWAAQAIVRDAALLV